MHNESVFIVVAVAFVFGFLSGEPYWTNKGVKLTLKIVEEKMTEYMTTLKELDHD